uniref:SprT-like domain-containing protein n=1 Tax=Leptobrachium leishanense TaxID=445787 RepID=A0A8C5Q1K4_9ANUR
MYSEVLREFQAILRITRMSEQLGLTVVDPIWESIDPNPDIRCLLRQFNHMFFKGRLSNVEAEWSKRMTTAAGICDYYHQTGRCVIRLSEPILKQRPRKDVVEILLHEMIHAYMYVTKKKDDGAHGTVFLHYMKRINAASGANITVTHHFYAEMRALRKHWWQCNGPCGKIIRRATNRTPTMTAAWRRRHGVECGGEFIKIKEPENYVPRRKRDDDDEQSGRPAKKPRTN